MSLEFKGNTEILTLGVEMEVQLLDANHLCLIPKAPEILQLLEHPRLVKEMFRSTLEVITGICKDVHQVSRDLSETMSLVRSIGPQLNIVYAGTGTNPIGKYDERILTTTLRYQELLERNQWLIKRMAVYGLHVHIGMASGDETIRFTNFFLQFIPHLIALSASSPYWMGMDTGLMASRPTIYES
ncbi:MAG: glutamate-cysteine ligase family protein, partial [Saprospiraceae bacterium]